MFVFARGQMTTKCTTQNLKVAFLQKATKLVRVSSC